VQWDHFHDTILYFNDTIYLEEKTTGSMWYKLGSLVIFILF